ncbi:MAG: 16S rRNA (cytidine(1402)-2'-O)-methyltransferase [Firmicutes bacterium]|nr:16S rRNA (cytidine(1402)-2'-O)-methyltransferase [Bacillota bacterium]MCM1400825.1 16S rRNA (cytidine(1402)-2'-O)-methyltransferase [Bacteroides sp.]MCM1476684.1 16S rRNA (cytidine(1402)-2'-O)-methyltransferase [Bacteroides sp.]
MSGKLIMVPTPVGNLGDMSQRAVDVLRDASLILAEDTRTSSVLLRHFSISTPMLSYHKFNEHESLGQIMDRLKQGDTVCLISDAGTPGISDPGFLLSRECRREGIEVITLPGPTAFVPALVNSGLPTDRFCYEGFLPQKKGRQSRLKEIAAEKRTSVIYESPLRLVKTLEQLAVECGVERQASVSREISKLHEETVRGTLQELVEHFSQNNPKGEIVIVLAGAETDTRPRVHRNKFRD